MSVTKNKIHVLALVDNCIVIALSRFHGLLVKAIYCRSAIPGYILL